MSCPQWKEVGVDDLAARTPNALATGPFGSAIGSKYFRTSGVPVIRGGNLSANSEVRLSDESLVFLDQAKAVEFTRSVARRGDLVFTSWGTINQVGLIDDSAAYDSYVISNKQMKFTPDPGKSSAEFLYYLFSTPAMQRVILNGAVGTGVPGFNLTRLRSLKFLVPCLAEQQKIAHAIGETDKLIAGLKSLIAKKRDVRLGMAQELLTGRTRLPGFSGRWVEGPFEDFIEIKKGSVVPPDIARGNVPIIAAGKSPAGYVSVGNRAGEVITISASGASAGYIAFHDGPIWASDCSTIEPREGIDLRFAFYALAAKQQQVYLTQTGGAQPHVHAKDVYPIRVRFPVSTDEQGGIACVLGDADREVEALRRRLEAARAVKIGMMQELLTGRTRLQT